MDHDDVVTIEPLHVGVLLHVVVVNEWMIYPCPRNSPQTRMSVWDLSVTISHWAHFGWGGLYTVKHMIEPQCQSIQT